MKYQWLEEKIETCEELGSELGCKVKSIVSSDIIVGYESSTDIDGKLIQLPIIRRGIEIEFDDVPSIKMLEKIDRKLLNLKREGGRTLNQEVDDLKARIEKLESIKIG